MFLLIPTLIVAFIVPVIVTKFNNTLNVVKKIFTKDTAKYISGKKAIEISYVLNGDTHKVYVPYRRNLSLRMSSERYKINSTEEEIKQQPGVGWFVTPTMIGATEGINVETEDGSVYYIGPDIEMQDFLDKIYSMQTEENHTNVLENHFGVIEQNLISEAQNREEHRERVENKVSGILNTFFSEKGVSDPLKLSEDEIVNYCDN